MNGLRLSGSAVHPMRSVAPPAAGDGDDEAAVAVPLASAPASAAASSSRDDERDDRIAPAYGHQSPLSGRPWRGQQNDLDTDAAMV